MISFLVLSGSLKNSREVWCERNESTRSFLPGSFI
jgi:hypothetical protein